MHKLLKHQKKTLGTLRDLHGVKSVGRIQEDRSRGLRKYAKPVGVVAALTPVTNASSTLCCNGLSILKGRNAVIFAPHPSATRTAELTCSYMRAALSTVGAPEHLVQNIAEPSIPLTQELMKAVDLIVATGGAAMVKAAYWSGTPSYGVGAGNSICIVDETADLADAAHKIVQSKTFDNATSCSSENSVVIHEAIVEEMLTRFAPEEDTCAVRRTGNVSGASCGPTGHTLTSRSPASLPRRSRLRPGSPCLKAPASFWCGARRSDRRIRSRGKSSPRS